MRPDNTINTDGKLARAFGARSFAAGYGERWASASGRKLTISITFARSQERTLARPQIGDLPKDNHFFVRNEFSSYMAKFLYL